MSAIQRHWPWLTISDWAIIVAMLLLVLVLTVVSVLGAARDRRLLRERRRVWARHYFQEGGLILALMKRWRGPAKLTDQRAKQDQRN